MTAEDALEEFTNEQLATMQAAIAAGTIEEARLEAIFDILDEATLSLLNDVAEDKPALVDLIRSVENLLGREMEIIPIRLAEEGEEPGPALDGEAASAVDMIESLLMPTAGRDPDFFFRLREALETGNAEFSEQITQEQLDQIPESERQRLAERADEVARQTVIGGLTRNDFPAVERATNRASGRTVENYWEPLLEQLETGDPDQQEILESQGVPDDQIEALMRNASVRNEFIEKVEGNIEAIRGPAEQQPVDRGPAIDVSDRISARVRSIVPDTRQRTDPITGETFTADPDLEQRFLEFVINVRGSTDRFDTHYFRSSPARRRSEFITMESWTRLQIQAGNATVREAERAGLPDEWLDDLG